jgi:Bacterial EndoU nuclease/Pretoxin HINT domain
LFLRFYLTNLEWRYLDNDTTDDTPGLVLETTPEHPFLVNNTWVNAEDLMVDTVLTSLNDNNEIIPLGTITATERIDQEKLMYNLTVDTAHTFFVGEGEWLVHNAGPCVDLLHPDDIKHILFGDGPGSGGHLWPGQPGKTPFPQNWSGDQILHNVSDIITDPTTKWFAQTGKGGTLTSSGNPARWIAWEVRDGVQVRVVYEPATSRVPTSFPDPLGNVQGYKPIR